MLRQFEAEDGEIFLDLGLSADGSLLAARRATSVTVWSARTGEVVRSWSSPDVTPYPAVAISPAGDRVTADLGRGPIALWSVGTGEEIARLLGHSGPVEGLAFSADGALLASGAADRTVRLWDGRTGAPRWASEGHADRVYALAFSPDGTRLASGSNDTTLRIWDVPSGEAVAHLRGHSDYVFSVAFSPDGSRLASGSGDHTLRIWDAEPMRIRWPAAVRSRRARSEGEPAVRALLEAEPDRAQAAKRLREDPSLDPLRREASIQALLRLAGELGGGR
ncbi:MAG: WD40 repeat domain-containing protein [Planctomycetes bacterium]|nr:WD40 repeat domain-containing protein [Planctomycetota bacterium]